MLILVGVTVTVALNGGLFDQARKAAKGMTMAQIQEKADMVKALLIADLQTNEGVVVVKQEYMNRLQQEFEDSEIKGNKVIVEDGKYGIIVKNGDLDIEITENPNYVDKSELLTLKATPTEITEDGKVYGIELSLTLTANLTSADYVAQETEKAKNIPSNISYEEKEQAVLEYLSGDLETQINSLDDALLLELNQARIEDESGNLIEYESIKEWLNDATLKKLIVDEYELNEETQITRGHLYMIIYGEDFTAETTEEEIIIYLYDVINAEDYDSEYYDNTHNLEIYLNEELIDESCYVNKTISTTPVNKNGEYKVIVKKDGNIVTSEIIQVNNIETNNSYVLSTEEAKDIWITDGEGTITKYNGTDENVIVPCYIGDEKIISVGGFSGNNNIKEVVISEGITIVDTSAFADCSNLKCISFPDSLMNIYPSAFYQCVSITTLELPNNLDTIASRAFKGVLT